MEAQLQTLHKHTAIPHCILALVATQYLPPVFDDLEDVVSADASRTRGTDLFIVDETSFVA